MHSGWTLKRADRQSLVTIHVRSCTGKVVAFHKATRRPLGDELFTVQYDDGDVEDYSRAELGPLLLERTGKDSSQQEAQASLAGKMNKGGAKRQRRRHVHCIDEGRAMIVLHKGYEDCSTSLESQSTTASAAAAAAPATPQTSKKAISVGAGPSLARDDNDAKVRIVRGKRRSEDASVDGSAGTANPESLEAVRDDLEGAAPDDKQPETNEERKVEDERIANTEEDGDDGEEVTEYERQRQANIRRNAGILAGEK